MVRGGRPPKNTGPHCHNPLLLPRSGPQHHTLPSSGWKSCRQGGDVLSRRLRPQKLGLFFSVFSYRRIGEEKKNRNHPRFRIQHVRRRRPSQVERQIFPFQIFSPSSSFGFHGFSPLVYLFDTFDCLSKTCLDRGGRDVVFLDHRDVYETGFQWVILFMEDLFFFLLILHRSCYFFICITVDINLERYNFSSG